MHPLHQTRLSIVNMSKSQMGNSPDPCRHAPLISCSIVSLEVALSMTSCSTVDCLSPVFDSSASSSPISFVCCRIAILDPSGIPGISFSAMALSKAAHEINGLAKKLCKSPQISREAYLTFQSRCGQQEHTVALLSGATLHWREFPGRQIVLTCPWQRSTTRRCCHLT